MPINSQTLEQTASVGWPIPAIPSTPQEFDWSLTPIEISSYEKFFEQTDSDGDGFIDSTLGKGLLQQSGFPQSELAQIWTLSDVDKDDKLSKQEYVIALQLVAKRRQGVSLPEKLPETLLAYWNSGKEAEAVCT